MTTSPLHQMAELMVQKSLVGLNVEEQQQFDRLKRDSNVSDSELQNEIERIELAAAAADLACFQNDTDMMPDHLKDCVLVEAGKFFESQTSSTSTDEVVHRTVDSTRLPRQGQRINPWLIGTIVSTAACLMLLINSFNASSVEFSATVSQKFEQFIEEKPVDMIEVALLPGPDSTGGNLDQQKSKLYWSESRQEGYMEIAGLAINDPDVEQYQLWILRDADDQLPVDGGVFDISVENDLVAIDAKVLAVGKFFAITVEPPGGVVKSTRERIASIGKNFADALAEKAKGETQTSAP